MQHTPPVRPVKVLLVLWGVWERDEIRREDSFEAFEEIFQLAQDHDVDMVLLGGDLFHDNKPSRTAVVRPLRGCLPSCSSWHPSTRTCTLSGREGLELEQTRTGKVHCDAVDWSLSDAAWCR